MDRQLLPWVLLCHVALACSHEVPFHRGEFRADLVARDAIEHRLILLGDAGAPDPEGEPSLRLVARRGAELPHRTTIVFLGDNVYETVEPPARWLAFCNRPRERRNTMRLNRRLEEGRVGWIVLWLVGIPIPVLVLLYLLRGCT